MQLFVPASEEHRMRSKDRPAIVSIALFLVFAAAFPLLSHAQENSAAAEPPLPVHRPRVGLALSGGGALGLAALGGKRGAGSFATRSVTEAAAVAPSAASALTAASGM